MPSQLTIFFLFFGGLQGMLFSAFLIRKKLHRSGYIFLLIYFAVLLLQITLKLMSKGWLMENWLPIYQLSYQLPFLYGPLIYLFVRQMLGQQSFKSPDLLHFTPFFLLTFFFGLGTSFADSPVALFPFMLVKLRLVLQLVSFYIYHWFAFQCWKNKIQQAERFYTPTQFNWLKKFIAASFVLCVVIAVLNYFMVVLYPQLDYIRSGFLVLTLFVYWTSYEALYHPELFSVIKGFREEPIDFTENVPRLTIHRAKKYNKSNLGEEEADRIMAALHALMTQQKLHLDASLNIDQLATRVDTNRHHLSQVLNERLKKSFHDYINHFRVEETRQLLSDPARQHLKIASIAYDAGFNSLSTFNDVFRKSTGMTPSQFRKPGEELSQKKRV